MLLMHVPARFNHSLVSVSLQVLVYLQLCKNINLVLLDGWQEITNHVCAVTKALSKRPFKYEATPVIIAH